MVPHFICLDLPCSKLDWGGDGLLQSEVLGICVGCMAFAEINPMPLELALGQADTCLASAAFIEEMDKPWLCPKRKALHVASLSVWLCAGLCTHPKVLTTQRFLWVIGGLQDF